MILLVKTNSNEMHDLEFVKPVEKIIKENKIKYSIKHYSKIKNPDLKKSSKIIICGTSLRDNEFFKNIKKFSWIKDYENSILGICAGMQIISLSFGGQLKSKTEIGFYEENFEKNFLGLEGKNKVYHLHTKYISIPNKFEKHTKSKIPQAIKHTSKPIYGVLFHPEVRNKKVIENFINL